MNVEQKEKYKRAVANQVGPLYSQSGGQGAPPLNYFEHSEFIFSLANLDKRLSVNLSTTTTSPKL